MSPAKVLKPVSFEEYLAFEEKAQIKHELVDGILYAMAGASDRHNRVLMNIAGHLWQAARKGPCRVYANDMKLKVDRLTGYYPDVMVVCDPDDNETYYKKSPCLIVEVLSKGTEGSDRREKLHKYRKMASLKAYILVDSLSRRVEGYYREGKRWLYLDVAGEGRFPVPCPEMELSLDEVYESLEVPLERPDPEFQA